MEVIVFSKKDCPPCDKLKAAIPDFQEEYPTVVWTILDYDDNPTAVKSFNITKTPTSVIMKSNQVINIIIGLDYSKIHSTLKFLTKSAINTDSDF
jgi:thiol-disulfide isomerase/thioredoxin